MLLAFLGCKVLPNISMHAVDMAFQSRDLRDWELRAKKWDFFVGRFSVTFGRCVRFQLAAKLSNQ